MLFLQKVQAIIFFQNMMQSFSYRICCNYVYFIKCPNHVFPECMAMFFPPRMCCKSCFSTIRCSHDFFSECAANHVFQEYVTIMFLPKCIAVMIFSRMCCNHVSFSMCCQPCIYSFLFSDYGVQNIRCHSVYKNLK